MSIEFIRNEVAQYILQKVNTDKILIPLKRYSLGKLKPIINGVWDVEEDDSDYGIWTYCENCVKNHLDLTVVPEVSWGFHSIVGVIYCKDCNSIVEYELTEVGCTIETKFFIENGLPNNSEDYYRLKQLLISNDLSFNNIKKLVDKFLPEYNIPLGLIS